MQMFEDEIRAEPFNKCNRHSLSPTWFNSLLPVRAGMKARRTHPCPRSSPGEISFPESRRLQPDELWKMTVRPWAAT